MKRKRLFCPWCETKNYPTKEGDCRVCGEFLFHYYSPKTWKLSH